MSLYSEVEIRDLRSKEAQARDLYPKLSNIDFVANLIDFAEINKFVRYYAKMHDSPFACDEYFP